MQNDESKCEQDLAAPITLEIDPDEVDACALIEAIMDALSGGLKPTQPD